MKRLRVIAFGAMLLAATAAMGAVFTSNGTGGGNWNSSGTWGGAGVPISGDTVFVTSGDTVFVNDLENAGSVTIDTAATLRMDSGGVLSLSAAATALSVNAPATTGTSMLQFAGGTLTVSNGSLGVNGSGSGVAKIQFTATGGTLSVKNDLTFTSPPNAQVDFLSGGAINIGGNLGSGGTLTSTTSTFNFNGSGSQTINGPYTFYNLTIAKSAGTATLNASAFVNGNLTISNGIFDDGGNQITLNGAGTSNVNIGSSGVLKLGSATSNTLFPVNVNPSNIFFSPGSAVAYHSALPQTINTAITYRRLFVQTIGGPVTHSFTGTLNVAEDLNVNNNGANATTLSVGVATLNVNTDISGDGTVSVGSGSIFVGGNWNSAVSLSAGSNSTVTYNGGGSQSVRAGSYYNLVVNKSGGTATLAGATSTTNDLTVIGSGTLSTNGVSVTVGGAFSNTATFNAGSSTISFLGSITNNGTVTASSATFRLNGTVHQVWSSGSNITLNSLEINNAAGASIGNNTTVNGSLLLNGGNVNISGTFFIDVLATVTRNSGWFLGPLTMGFNASPARRMHLGTSAAYLPIDIDAATSGTVTAQAVEGQHPNRTGTRVLARYWTIGASTVTLIDSLTFNYNAADVTSGVEMQFMLGHYNGAWTRDGDVVSEALHTATLTNVSSYMADWVVGHAGSMGGAGKLYITQVNGGSSPYVNTPFSVDVQARTDDNSANGNAFSASTVDVTLAAGSGSLGTMSGTLNAGSSFTTVSNLTYDTAESNVQLTAGTSSGDAIDSGTSAPFSVLSAPTTLTVTSINDSGAGTLRDAIDLAESGGCGTPCTINFSTSGNIVLASDLTTITRSDLTINGYSAPGASPNTNAFGLPSNAVITVSVDGASTVNNGFTITGQNDVIKGLAIKNCINDGVHFGGTNTGSAVVGCFLGTDTTGTVAAPNGNGVGFTTSNSGSVGGTAPADRNVISGNSMYGIYAGTNSTNIAMYGNYIGVKANLSGALPNDDGIQVTQASTAMIGMLGGGNLISGNTGKGIEMLGSASILANLIGTNGTGTAAIPNDSGIYLGATSNNVTIGPSELNVVSGNTNNGIEVQGTNISVDNVYVGVGLDGVTAIPNGGIGVRISGSGANNSIGATAANKIAHNGGGGVSVATSALGVGNVIRKNAIHSNANGTPAIDLAEDGITPNDATDSDLGPNNLQNFPTISSAAVIGGNVSLSVSVNSSGATTGTSNFIIDVYKADSSSPEQALEYLGSSGCVIGPVLTGYAFSVPAGTTVNGNKIVATATSYLSSCATVTDGTSELSAAVTATSDIHWINSSGGNWETASNWSPATVPTSSDTVYIDASGTYSVQINSAATAGALHVGTGTTGTQTLTIPGGTSLTLSSPSDVATTGNVALSGTLTGGGSLDVNGVLDWNAGTISGVAALNVNAGATLNVNTAANHILSQRLLTILASGSANWLGGAWLMQTGGGIVNNGTFDIKCDQSLADNGSDAGFTNSGTLRKSVTSGTTSFVNVDLFHNAGTLDIQTGALDVGAGSAAAAIAVSSGAELLINSDTFTLAAGASMAGAGKIHVTAGTLNVTGASVSVEHLYLAGGTLDGTGTITTGSTGSYQWDGGNMSGSGATIIATGGSMLMTSAGSKFLAQRTLTIQSGATVSFGGTGVFFLQNGGNVANAGIFDIVADATIADNGSAGAIVNTNTFKKTGGIGGTTVITNVTLNNSGTINIQTGTLDPADVNNSGAIAIGGTLLINSNTFTMSAGTSLSGSGLLQVTAGTLTVNSGVTVANLQLDGGIIGGTGAFFANAFTWNGGTLSGSGSTSIPLSGTATIATAANHTLARTFNVNFGANATYSGSGAILLQSGGNIANAGTFDITNNGTFADNGSAGAVVNSGTFRKSTSSGTATFSNIDFNHTGGTLDIQTGTLDLAAGTSSAAISIGSGAAFLVNSNTYQFATGTTVSGSGTVYLTAGTLNVSGNVAIPQFNFGGGTLDGAGTVSLTNTATWDSGVMQGGGTTTVDPSATLTIGSAGSHFLSNRTLTTAATGTITYANNGALFLQNGSSINNAGLFEITGDGSLNDNGGAASSFTNSGTLRRSTSTNPATFTNITLNHNSGSIDVLTGTLDLAAGTSNAPISIAGGAFFLVNSNTFTLGAGTTVSGAGTLSLAGGTLNVTSNVSVPQFVMSGGILDGTATLSLTNTADWSAGTMQGGGTTALNSGATMTITSASGRFLSNRTLSTTGTAILTFTGGGTLFLQNGGNIANAGTFVTDADVTFADNGSGGAFVNSGTFRKQTTTGSTTFSNLAFNNSGGLVDLLTGTLAVQSYTQNAAGTLKVRLGGTATTAFSKLAVSSSPTLAGTLQVTLNGPYQPVGGDTFRILTSPGGAHSGDFTHPYSYPALSGGRSFSDAFDSTGLLLTVNGFADLSIAKSAASNNFPTSSPITYTLEVNNTSPDFANNVSVTDTLPSGHTGISASGSGWTCNVVGDTVTCNANAALPSGIAPDIFVNATTPSTPQTFINSATVSSSNDPNGTNNSANWTIIVGSPAVDLDVSSLSPASPVAQSTAFTFDFIIKNNGPATATGVVFTAPIPPQITYNNATPDQGSCNFVSNTVTCNLGTIASLAAPHVLLSLTTGTTPGTHYVTGSATAAETDSNPGNNSIPTAVQVIGATLTVTNTNDAGAGSLRQALLDAANTSGCPAPCTIGFNITGSAPFTIQPQSDLPPVPASAVVDATSQPGYGGAPVVVLDGTLTPTTYLLTLSGGSSTVRGFSLINATKGLWINSNNNVVESNYIGITPALAAAANAYGIVVDGSNNRIGGTSGSPNTIAQNTNSGIVVVTGIGNEITGNDIHANGGIGIDLGNDGTTANDATDADTGPDNLQNFPTLTAAFVDASNDIHLQYNIDSSGAANTSSILVEMFKADSAVSGEGRTFLARACFAFDAFGGGTSFNAPSVAVGDPIVLTATAYSDTNCTTISDGTSEFSNVVLTSACSVPPATLNAPANACASSTTNTASVTAPTATQFDWTVTGGALLTGQNTPNITFSAPASGTVNISVTVRDNNGCPNTQSSIVNVIAAPAPAITGPATSCAGSPVTLDAGAGFTSYSWSTGATTRTITVSPSTTTTYTVIVSNGTCSGSDTHTVNVNPLPAVNITGPAASCSGSPVTLDAGAGFATYSWSTGATTRTITVTPSATTTYSVTVTNGSGCSGSDTHTVTVGTAPVVNITGPTTVCPNETFALDAGNFATYQWNTGLTTRALIATQTAPSVTYSVIVTDANGCSATGTHTVTLSASPDATVSAPLSVDANSTNNAASVPSQPGATYAWSITNGTITGGGGSNSILFTAGASGVVNLDVTVTIGSCSASSAAGVAINGTAPQSDFGVVKHGPSSVKSGEPIAWNLVVTNNGTAGATAQIVDTLPSGVTVSGVNGGAWSCTTTPAQVTCAGFLAANASNSVDIFAFAPSQPGSITNSVVVQTFAGDANPNNDSASVTTSVVASDAPPCSQPATLVSPANDATVTNSLVELRWIPAANAAASRVWISRNGAPFASAGETTGDSLTTYISDGEVLWYVEELFNGCASTQSAQRRFVVPAGECNLHAPSILAPANNSTAANALTNIQWTSESAAIAYEVWMSFEGAVPSLLGTTANTSFTYLLPQSGAYDVFIRALGNRCGTRDSQSVRFRYDPPTECANRRRAILISPLDDERATSPVSFSWAPSAGATRYELYVVRGTNAPQLVATTNATEATAQLNNGHVRWFVRAIFGENCSPMDSEPRELEIVSAPNACAAIQPPVISTPGEISSGVEFLLQWTSRPGATTYELQVSSNSDFSGAETFTTASTMHALTRTNNGNTPLAVYARVRAIDARCTPQPAVTAYGPVAAIFVLPRIGVIGSVPLADPDVVHYTIALGSEFAGQTFTATPTESWLTVTPTSGVVAPSGTNLDVTADGAGLGVGGHTGAVKITLNTASARVVSNATTSVNPSISINLVTPVASTPANTPSPDTMIVPAVANADGINAHFQSDVRVANTSAQLIKYQLTFIPSGDSGITKGAQTTFSIEPGRTIALDDILRSFFGTGTSNAVGVLQIKPLTSTSSSTSSAAFGPLANLVSFASSRTFNVTPNGTFGQYVPAVPYANFADKSTVLSLQQIAQNSRTRSNLGLVEGSGNPADLLIKVFGGNGQQITSFTQHLNGGQHTQLNSFLFERGITLEDGRIEVQVTSSSGKVTAYASVLDNETSDAVLVTPVALGSAGNTKWVIPGVADIRSGFADWQSDVRVFNAGTEPVDVTASFYSQSGGEPKVQTLTLAAGEVKQLDKILPNFFGVTNDGGALHLATAKASRIVATARTYNQTSKGTFGQFVNGVTPSEAVAVGTRPLQLLQVEESPRMRSNVGFAEVTGKPVKLEVTVTPPDAKFAAVIEVDLAANEFRQLGSLLAGLGLGDTYNARVSVRAISGEGRATAYASVIDLLTNDPTFVFPQ